MCQAVRPTPAPTGLDWTAILIPLLPVIVTGVLASPYVTWRLEKLRKKHERRVQFIEDWKTYLDKSVNEPELLELTSLIQKTGFMSIKNLLEKDSDDRLTEALKKFHKLRTEKVKFVKDVSQNNDAYMQLMQEIKDYIEGKLGITELSKLYSEAELLALIDEHTNSEQKFDLKNYKNAGASLEKVLGEIESDTKHEEHLIRTLLRRELARIEKKWGLL